MKTDLSFVLFQKYFALENRNITVLLKNHKKYEGRFIAFSKGNVKWNEPYIFRWHLVDKDETNSLGIDAFGFTIGTHILQSEIESVHFEGDNTIMYF